MLHYAERSSDFDDLLGTWRSDDREVHPPFRDQESQRLLKESYGVTFVSDDDWYSVIVEGRRMAISCLYEGIKFGLLAIHCSRQGEYTIYQEVSDEIWKVLEKMPFDILLAVHIRKIGIFSSFPPECRVINFPYKNQKIEVDVIKKFDYPDNFYEVLKDDDAGMCQGKDKKYYMCRGDVKYYLQYYWKKDIKGIIQYIKKNNKNRVYLGRIHQIFDVFELGEILSKDENSIMLLDYLFKKNLYNRLYQEGKMDEQKLQKAILKLQESKEYEEYLYFRDTFKVINHLETVPPSPLFRKLPILMVDKNKDGTYYIHGTLTYKYPEFHELLCKMILMRNPDRDRYALVVDENELLFSARDMKDTMCGFKIMADSLEIFGKREGLQIFGEVLKEAWESENCTVSKEFY